MIEQTVDGLKALRLAGMVVALQEQQLSTEAQSLAFEERLAMLVDREIITRDNKRIDRLLRNARLKHNQASLEEVRYSSARQLDKP